MTRRTTLSALLLVSILSLPAFASAQEPWTCPDGQDPRASLGITSFVCHCTYRTDAAGERGAWDFDSEPRVLGIEAGGPADGALEEGDWIVAIDGHLITTDSGGRRWSSLQPGERVRLKVRRDGATREVELVVGARCGDDAPEPRETASALPDPTTGGLPRLLPRGWLGVGLSCDCSVDTGGGSPRWTFHDAPVVGAVAPGSPASGAGIREGDVLLAIDGAPLVTEEGGAAFSRIEPGQRVRLTLERDRVEVSVELVAEEKR